MKFKSNRAISFIILAVIYALAIVVGIVIYKILPYAYWLNLLLADVAATLFTFIFSLIFNNASVYDPYWSVQPIVILTAFAWGNQLTVYGIFLLVAVWFWGLRLTANWAYTFADLNHQDWRYTHYQNTTGKLYPFINLTGIHLVPTLIVYGCTLPAVTAIYYSLPGNFFSCLFCVFSICAAIMQGTADIQMHRFRKNRTSSFIRVGLWKYSRHPNYLGEICMWWGIYLSFLFAQPEMWYMCIGAIANTVLFLIVSIPLADNRQSRKEGFEEYKNGTHKLIPLKLNLDEDYKPALPM